jgi:nucleotide-binding universal stress UspA family protein
MLPFRTILFPVDFTEPCVAIVPYVKHMQQHFATELGLIHAYGPEALAYSDLPIIDPRLPDDTRALQEERLSNFAQTHFPGLKVELFTSVGEAGSVIHEVVRRQGADLLMMPTHGRGPLRRMLLGSVTAKVLHDLTVPVWTGHPLRLPYRSVLCALDASNTDEAEAVLRAAIALAASFEAKLNLVTVLEIPPESIELGYSLYKNDFIAATETRVRDLKAKVGVDAPPAIIDGLIPEGIRDEALRVNADLIITGRGVDQGVFSRWWSHLYPIIRHAPCPILSI